MNVEDTKNLAILRPYHQSVSRYAEVTCGTCNQKISITKSEGKHYLDHVKGCEQRYREWLERVDNLCHSIKFDTKQRYSVNVDGIVYVMTGAEIHMDIPKNTQFHGILGKLAVVPLDEGEVF